jgi:hypothetical protein
MQFACARIPLSLPCITTFKLLHECGKAKARRDTGLFAFANTKTRNFWCRLTGQPAEKIALIHVILEGFPAIYKYYRNFVGELAAE